MPTSASVLDLDRLRHTHLHKRPLGQVLTANLLLRWDYRFPRKTEIVLEGQHHLPPGGGAFLAMNHTDRYNYWPFQYELYRQGLGYTATWVKGKYYSNSIVARFLDSTNNIPLPSRGYVLVTEFRRALGRSPNDEEYRLLRDHIDGQRSIDDLLTRASGDARRFLEQLGDGDAERFHHRFHEHFDTMMRQAIELTRSALEDLGLYVLVFPQGTRSKRLIPGHTGLVQVAQYLSTPIIPVGCNGSDQAYPDSWPISRGGRIVYRIGRPLAVDEPPLAEHRVDASVLPFTDEATERFGSRYEAMTKIVMDRINELLDPAYQYASQSDPEQGTGPVSGLHRFL